MRKIRLLSVMDRMMVSDLLKTIFSVLAVLVIIIVSRNFIKILQMAVDGLISTEAIFGILGLKIILASASFLVPSVFVSVLMVLGRMYRDQEMSALSSAGAGVGRFYLAVFKAITPVVLLSIWLALYVSPWAADKVEQVIFEQKQSIGVRAIAEGKFSEYNQGNLIFYVESIGADNVMHDVFVQNKRGNDEGIVTAETAEVRIIDGALYIVFINGERVQGKAGEMDFIFETFGEYAMRLEASVGAKESEREGIETGVLLQTQNLDELRELYRRLSIPLSIIVLTVMAVPLAQVSPRSGVYGNLVTAFLIYFSFANFEKVSASWMVEGEISTWLGFWGVYMLASVFIVFLLVRLYGLAWVLMKLRGAAL
ncbi:MAG: LPS export ABC transporter permease LptF [Methylococcaceae bacterium]|nr:LPS export ABC transporter permease LptF [Methylococcaceae bacterium]